MRITGRSQIMILLIVLLMLFGLSWAPVASQDDEVQIPPVAAFVAYQCEFDSGINSARIRAVLMGSDGRPIPRAAYTVNVSTGGVSVANDQVTVTPVSDRPALQMFLVLDLTETVPIEQIVNAVSTQLVPQLGVQDEVALITFSEDVAPPTQFYIDKNRLLNEHMLDLITVEGENRLYDAILSAVTEMPFDSDKRQVVLVLTDSNRRDTEQTATDVIIREAASDDVQVYSIGFFTRDQPDINELIELANGTGGFSWFYTEIPNSRASIETAVSAHLNDFVETLNSEILIDIDAQTLEPDVNDQVVFDVTIEPSNEIVLTDQISCPIERLDHSIRFLGDLEDATVLGSVDVGVAVDTDMDIDETRIVFRVDNEIVQNSTEQVYTFDAGDKQPGYYDIGAQLVDSRSNRVLATTARTVRFYVQHEISLSLIGDPDQSENPVRFQLDADPEIDLLDAVITATSVTNPALSVPLSDLPVPFGPDGRAVLTINDLPALLLDLFPDLEEGEDLRISAYVPGVTDEDPDQAVSDSVFVQMPPPPPPPPEPIIPEGRYNDFIPIGISIFLLTLNLLLFRAVGRLRIRKYIANEDKHDLSPQLMAITVRRDGMKQTHTLTKKTIMVGRGALHNDISLGDNPNISRQHGVIMWRKEAWYYTNRKRLAQATINGKQYRGLIFHKLEAVTEIEIGHALLIFHSAAQQDISDHVKTNF